MTIDKKILKGCLKNDRKSQEVLYHLLYPDLIRVAFKYTLNQADAEDVLNKAMLKVFTRIKEFRGTHENFGGWIKRILVNESLDFLRSRKTRKSRIALDNSEEEIAQPEEPHDDTDYILELMKQLPETTLAVFNLYVIEGYSHKEIAEKLSISVSNSKWHLHSARKSLQNWLKQKNLV